MVKRLYTTWQLLRYPVVFGGCLTAYFTAFSFRKTYFKDEIAQVQAKNLASSVAEAEKMEATKQALRAKKANQSSS